MFAVIDDKIFDPETYCIMIILNNEDKVNLSNMAPDANAYAAFPGNADNATIDKWMKENIEICLKHKIDENNQKMCDFRTVRILKRSRVPNWLVVEDAEGIKHEVHLDSIIPVLSRTTVDLQSDCLKKHAAKRKRKRI